MDSRDEVTTAGTLQNPEVPGHPGISAAQVQRHFAGRRVLRVLPRPSGLVPRARRSRARGGPFGSGKVPRWRETSGRQNPRSHADSTPGGDPGCWYQGT